MIDLSNVVEKGELLVVPYNSARFLRTRAAADQLLDCWPILVNLRSGAVRFGRLEERALWR
ncbi:hypothetical protein NX801_26965 [Streptomyces sp. LP05-1]|uniref:Uncharacterized protein n=1 Tax=Streptomyces pyxinae TaxID=2970734 RepID=A0ABT2CP45_9ACTN|nr:hypothetical protein [Streptomyces sp. LP05-1]MCS0639217.1 hypothetical protein [Streptomyces sp. LP05-1]